MDAAYLLGMARNPDNDAGGAWGWMRDALPQIAAATCLVMIGTCLNMWSTQQLIQQSINTLVKSDAGQDRKIEELSKELFSVKVELGVMRGRLIDVSRKVN